jgi:hypothetical protein
MSFDPSRQLYPHPTCGTLPCSCERVHGKLEFQLLQCYEQGCSFVAYTIGMVQEHHLDKHERPLPQRLVCTD